jgi:hypothetical protein
MAAVSHFVLKGHWRFAGRTLGERGGPINYSDADVAWLGSASGRLVPSQTSPDTAPAGSGTSGLVVLVME